MSCMMRLLALQLPILLQLVQLWVVLGRLASPMDGRIRHIQCIRGQCHRRGGKQPRHLGKIEAQGI